jgi:glycosyltransferase involved in cell wall biosynthesis
VVLYPSEDEVRALTPLLAHGPLVFSVPAYSYSDEDLHEGRENANKLGSSKAGNVILFVGGFAHSPNKDGILWFVEDVLPLLRQDDNPWQLMIAGSNADEDIRGAAAKDVCVLGFVSDEKLNQLYQQAAVVIAPLRYGAGVKGKVIEAMAKGVPVVTTSVGAQGIAEPEGVLFIANTAEHFAGQVREAAVPVLGRSKAMAALDYVQKTFSPAAMSALFTSIMRAETTRVVRTPHD